MICLRVRDILLTSYQDGSLSPKLQIKLQKHIETCALCRELERSVTLLSQKLKQAPAMEPPPDTWENIRENILAEQQKNRAGLPQRIRELLWFIRQELFVARRPLIGAAVIMILVTGGYRMVPKGTSEIACPQDTECFDVNSADTDYDLGTDIEQYFF